MEENYRQKYMFLAFIIILLTSLFFSSFAHGCHFIVFISMLSKFHLDPFFILYVVVISMLHFSFTSVNSYLKKIFIPVRYYIITLINVNSIPQTMKPIQWRRSRVDVMPHYNARRLCLFQVLLFVRKSKTAGYFAPKYVSLWYVYAHSHFYEVGGGGDNL